MTPPEQTERYASIAVANYSDWIRHDGLARCQDECQICALMPDDLIEKIAYMKGGMAASAWIAARIYGADAPADFSVKG